MTETNGHVNRTVKNAMAPVKVALNVWASDRWHRAVGGETAIEYGDVFREPAPPEPLGENVRQCDDSEQLYNATSDKYERFPPTNTDPRVLSAVEAVETVLRELDAPDWFKCYLLFKYPTEGRYVPERRIVRAADKEFDAARAFVDSGHWERVLEGFDSFSTKRWAARTIKSAEREFKEFLAEVLKNKKTYKGEERTEQ